MASDESAKRSNGAKAALTPSEKCRQVTLDWLSVYAQVYRQQLTPELVLAFQASLATIRQAEILDRAFLRAMKSSTFHPTPAEVLRAVEIELENQPKPKQLEADHELTAAEREEVAQSFESLRVKLRIPKIDFAERKRTLDQQKKEIFKKYGK